MIGAICRLNVTGSLADAICPERAPTKSKTGRKRISRLNQYTGILPSEFRISWLGERDTADGPRAVPAYSSSHDRGGGVKTHYMLPMPPDALRAGTARGPHAYHCCWD